MLLQIPAEEREVSCAILRWVTLAIRPLQLQELAAATGVRLFYPQETIEQAIRDAITLCGPLLKVQKQEVSLVHQSARDYLLRKERDSNAVLESFRLRVEHSHLELAQKCLQCIAQSGLQDRAIDFDAELGSRESPLLRYAALHWSEHAHNISAGDVALLHTLKRFFCTGHALWRHWWVAYRNKKLLSLPQTIPLLHMLCYLGFVLLVEEQTAWESWKPQFFKRINKKDSDGNTALHLAIRARNQEVAEVLIDNGAEVNARDKYKRTPLHRAAEEGDEGMVRLLIRKRADVNAEGNDNNTVLHSALSTRANNAVVHVLIDEGANVNAKNSYGITALHLATWEGNTEIVRWLVDGRADVNTIDRGGRTVLHSAVGPWKTSETIVLTLVNKGADLNTRGSDGSTVLHWAAEKGNEAVVRLLVDKGAAVNAKDNYGRTALQWASGEVELVVVLLLAFKGADVKAKTNDGCTVLHEAISALGGASRGNEELVKLLISIGADLRAKNKDGKTALHLAVEEENKAVVRLLRTEEWASKRRRTTRGRQQLRRRTRFLEALAHQ